MARAEGWFHRTLDRMLLRPFRDRLCTPMAGFWIFCARLAILIMATSEAISWGYLGFYFATGSVRIVTAIFVGLCVFTVIWLIDATFITLDTGRALYDKEILGKVPEKPRHDAAKTVLGILGRVGVIAASLYISAPFLAQIVFYRDIDSEIQRENARRTAEARQTIEAKHNELIESAKKRLAAAQEGVVTESAGRGLSGRYGRGAVVETLEERIREYRSALDQESLARDKALAEFDQLNPAALAERYGIQFVGEGLRARGEALAKLVDNPSYTKADLAVKAFLSFLFISLVSG